MTPRFTRHIEGGYAQDKDGQFWLLNPQKGWIPANTAGRAFRFYLGETTRNRIKAAHAKRALNARLDEARANDPRWTPERRAEADQNERSYWLDRRNARLTARRHRAILKAAAALRLPETGTECPHCWTRVDNPEGHRACRYVVQDGKVILRSTFALQ